MSAGTVVGSRVDRAFAAALLVVLLLWNNVVIAAVPQPAHVLVNGTATAVLLVAARGSGLSWSRLGLARGRLGGGLRWGGAAFGVVAVGCAVAVLVPALRPLVTDARVAGLDAGALAVRVLVRVPVGTVLWEEVAFRGVLPAAWCRVVPAPRAAVIAAAAFGIWHVRPTLSGLAANDLLDSGWLRAAAVVLVCVFTAAAGLVLGWLRDRSGSLLAPALLHLATNSLGTLASVAAGRLG